MLFCIETPSNTNAIWVTPLSFPLFVLLSSLALGHSATEAELQSWQFKSSFCFWWGDFAEGKAHASFSEFVCGKVDQTDERSPYSDGATCGDPC